MPRKIFIDQTVNGRFEISLDPPHEALSHMTCFSSFAEAAALAYRLAGQTDYAISDGTGKATPELWHSLALISGVRPTILGKLANQLYTKD